jgi:predicted ATP-grasp superfamily ATP-dependent carboligase
LNIDDDLAQVTSEIKIKLGYPAVFKPSDGVSCRGLSIIHGGYQIETAIAKIKAVSSRKSFVAQQFICGEAASVSLLCTGTEARAISLNKQDIQISKPGTTSSYEGGEVPFAHSLRPEAFRAAEDVAFSFSGLRGYVGVDLVLADDKAFVVDVNPRLTTSYVGLSEVAGFNVAEAMVEAVLKNQLPVRQENRGSVYFSKVKTPKPSVGTFQKATQLDGVISPPFPLLGNSEAVSLVAGHGESMLNAQLRFEEAKKRLLNIISGGK